ncbi:helix-turn-helix domain-containing protein [Laceyella putida]|uniref:Helix-turn-helix domain-containing protein n=1 Tax=Laceyella putida TaxID=110101 RepID=A0ABW2RQY2_9BACL
MTLGERLKQLREKRGLSQIEVSKRTGIPNHSLSNYERDQRTPPIESQRILADFYHVSLDYLVNGVRNIPKQTLDEYLDDYLENNQEIIFDGMRLSEEDVEYLINNFKLFVSMKKTRQKEA